MIPQKFTVLIVDCQNDFTNPKGTMYTETSDSTIPNIVDFVEKYKSNIEKVILVKNNHPENHCSFRYNYGIAKHCVEGTWGNEIDSRILNALKRSNLKYTELNIGEVDDTEEYSASSYSQFIDGHFILRTLTDATRVPTNDIVICGLPDDLCIANTTEDICKVLPQNNVHVLLNNVMNNSDTILNVLEMYPDVNIIYEF